MSFADHWLLPDGMDEVLPPQARQLESLRRRLLDLFHAWGYELVLPPKVEFLESLLTGAGHDLDLQTFKVTDQLSGRMMGVSADVTPQVARMDAHSMRTRGVARFCYATEVLRTRPDNLLGTRSPLQIGAELFGHRGIDSDLEILSLMLDALQAAGAEHLCLDLGHVSIYRSLVEAADLEPQLQEDLFDLLQHKRLSELDALLSSVSGQAVEWLKKLAHLNGGVEMLARAAQELAGAPAAVLQALSELKELATEIQSLYPELNLYLDLSELRGYHYHTGLVFAVYVPNLGQALAKGGRYDEIGGVFGRARPATGFSVDLKVLGSLRELPEAVPLIVAPVACQRDPKGRQLMQELRAQGRRILLELPGAELPVNIRGRIEFKDDRWQLLVD